jgi:uncharacterized protein (DUF697 family)/tellurite resistance protein
MKIPTSENESAESLIAICLFAAFADGEKSEAEREEVARLGAELGSDRVAAVSRQILMGKVRLEAVVAGLTGAHDRMLAYEMARAVCEADGTISAEEKLFLSELGKLLALGRGEVEVLDAEVDELALAPVDVLGVEAAGVDNSGMILKYAIVNGALELLPETLATMAIIPLQMKMVYRIGKSHGAELDRGHIKEFLATAGLGMGSQVVEGFARKVMRGFGKKLGGTLGGRVADELTGSVMSFSATYAIGHLAEKYHAGGRKLGGVELKPIYQSLSTQARELHARFLPQIQERAQSLNPAEIFSLVRGKSAV